MVSQTNHEISLEQISTSNNPLIIFIKKCFALLTNPFTYFKIKRREKKAYLLLTPQYNNLGDHAIALASIKWLTEIMPEYRVVEITTNYYKNCKKILSRNLSPDDIIFISGGGYMGDLWPTMEAMVRDILNSYSNKIVILPQTIYFESLIEKQNAKRIYSRDNTLFVLRDLQSYQMCTKELELKNVFYAPDIALIFPISKRANKKKSTIGVCIRTDHENVKSGCSKSEIVHAIETLGFSTVDLTTLLRVPFIVPSIRRMFVKWKINEISKNSLVITNRLHCMIFCYLSRTPCIAFDNKSKKVSGVYSWIKSCNYIRLYESDAAIQTQMETMLNINECIGGNEDILNQYEILKKRLYTEF